MAAPTTSYKSEKLPVIKGNSSGGIATQNDIYIAKFLQNTTPPSGDNWGDGYFNSTDTEAEKLTKIKGIFKIDGLCLVAKGAADGSAAETGFIGYCNSRISGNGLYHKTERFSGLKISIGASGGGAASTGELLNDASINVKGTCSISAITSDLENNAFKVTGVYRSAFYNATTAFGVKWSGLARKYTSAGGFETPTTWAREIDKGTRGVGQSSAKLTYTAESFSEPYNTDPYYELIAGEEYVITPYITNGEGRLENTPITHLMSGISAQMSWGETALLSAASSTYETVYKWTRGLAFYQEGGGDIPTVAGTRFDMTANGSTGGNSPTVGWWAYEATGSFRQCVKLDDYGVCIGVMFVDVGGSGGSGTPPTGYNSYSVAGAGISSSAADTDAYANLFVTQYSIGYGASQREWGRLVWNEGTQAFEWETADGYYYHAWGVDLITSGELTWYKVDYGILYINAGVLTDIVNAQKDYYI